MLFGEVPLAQSIGAILAHGVGSLKKGIIIDAKAIETLMAEGITHITIARLSEDDIHENEAATFLAITLKGQGVRVEKAHTGRVNLFAEHDGLFVCNESNIHTVNTVDEAVTVATLTNFKPVLKNEMVATVKIITFGVAKSALEQLMVKPLEVKPFVRKTVALIQTRNEKMLQKVLDKTVKTTASRLEKFGAALNHSATCSHDIQSLTQAINQAPPCDLLIIFGSSAIADRRDVIPTALEKAGGYVAHLGMPVDPGNLLMIGSLKNTPIIGAPGCARSPKENGFDWVLNRLMAGVDVSASDIKQMGVGGLIAEIETRPEPREGY